MGEGHIFIPLYIRTCLSDTLCSTVLGSALVEYLMLGFETCNTFQTCIEHAHKGNNILPQLIRNYVHLNDMHTLTISYCSIVLVSATHPTVFDAGI